MQDKEPNADPAEEIVRQVIGIREILQSVEDALMDSGYDGFTVATEHGTFRWMTVERARQQTRG